MGYFHITENVAHFIHVRRSLMHFILNTLNMVEFIIALIYKESLSIYLCRTHNLYLLVKIRPFLVKQKPHVSKFTSNLP